MNNFHPNLAEVLQSRVGKHQCTRWTSSCVITDSPAFMSFFSYGQINKTKLKTLVVTLSLNTDISVAFERKQGEETHRWF